MASNIEGRNELANVSIVVANYNNAHFIDDFMNSVQRSSLQPLELIIVDDDSKDNSLEILTKYLEWSYVRIIELKTNKGFGNALNIGIKEAKGKFIMCADPDDLIDPYRIFKQYKYLENHSEIDIVGSNMKYISVNLDVLFYSNMPLKNRQIIKSLKQGDIPLFNGTLMGKSEIFKNNPFNPEFKDAQDYDFLTGLVSKNYRLENLQDYLTNYRMHSQNQSHKDLWKKHKTIAKIRKEHFQIDTNFLIIFRNYLHTYLYRKFLHTFNCPIRYFWLTLATLLRPNKLLNRVQKVVFRKY